MSAVLQPAIAGPRETFDPRAVAMRTAEPPRLPEFVLHAAWRRAVWARTRNGEAYRILSPGRPGGGAGPDFKDAVLISPDGLHIRGDVEIHVQPAEWFGHGHDADKRYNGVAFHVAADQDDSPPATTRSGIRIPLILLPTGKASHYGKTSALRTQHERRGLARRRLNHHEMDQGALPQISLAQAGELRFLARSAGFALELRTRSVEQVVWQAALECLGYSQNRSGFRALGARLPWNQLKGLLGAGVGEEAAAELLLWAGGLGPFPSGLHAERRPKLGGKRPHWQLPGGRPDNHPVRRIRGAAVLALRFLEGGGLSATLEGWLLTCRSPREFLEHLQVASVSPNRRALIGPGRAREISINAVLPAVHALASRDERWHLAETSLALYRRHPKHPENGITREMRRVMRALGRVDAVTGAREQQGLIYLYRALTHGAVAHRGDEGN